MYDILCYIPIMKKGAKQVTLNIALTPELRRRLETEAKRKGIGPSTLARMLVIYGLERAQSSAAPRG
jgi:hypothetical protein